MGAPCIDDSCNVIAEINPETRHLTLRAKVAPDGGLVECREGNGLGIELLGNPENEAPTNNEFINLRLTEAGELWGSIESAVIQRFGSANPRRIMHDGSESLTAAANTNPIDDNSIVNPFATNALALIFGTLKVGWTIEEPADAFTIANKGGSIDYVPYHSEIRAQLITAVRDPGAAPTDWPTDIGASSAEPKASSFFDIGGMARSDKLPQHLRDWREVSFAQVVPAGKQLYMAARAKHYGDAPNYMTFVETEKLFGVAPDFAERGIMASGQVVWLPMNGTGF